MLITVITISFNQAQFLRECIDSVLNQDYSEIEYIVVDPGSTDGSREIIDLYTNRIISIYENDNGPADGLNKGFKNASGEIFCYLNSDDIFLPDAFNKVSTYFRMHPDVDVVFGNAHIIDKYGNTIRDVFPDKFSLKAAAYGASIAIQPSTFFRRNAFIAINGFNINNRSNWDGELLIDMALTGSNMQRINEFISCYRVHDESITGTGRLADKHVEYARSMFEKIMKRPFQKSDVLWKFFYKLKKHLASPKATLERVRKGPIFGTKKL